MMYLEGNPNSAGFASGIAIVYDYEVERKLWAIVQVAQTALVGLGIRELSLSPIRAAAARHAIGGIDSHQAAETAQLALQCRSPAEVRRLLTAARAEASSADLSAAQRMSVFRFPNRNRTLIAGRLTS